jgi:hypothetical protein
MHVMMRPKFKTNKRIKHNGMANMHNDIHWLFTGLIFVISKPSFRLHQLDYKIQKHYEQFHQFEGHCNVVHLHQVQNEITCG